MEQSRLHVVPVDFDEAVAFIREHHRHHRPPLRAKWSTAVAKEDGRIVGVATIGRPVARGLDNTWTVEVTRVATDGTPNACSALYRAAWRQAVAKGYRRLVTYTLAGESGVSLRAAGLRVVAEVKGRSWSCESRPRIDKHPTQDKLRWELTA